MCEERKCGPTSNDILKLYIDVDWHHFKFKLICSGAESDIQGDIQRFICHIHITYIGCSAVKCFFLVHRFAVILCYVQYYSFFYEK